jgi:porin
MFFCTPTQLLAQSGSADSNRIIQPGISYTGDMVNSFAGGIRNGTCYLGLVNIRISFSTESAKLWNGGELFVNGAYTHGAEPSAEYLGDIQVASNIEAGNHTYLQEFWYKHTWNFGAITAGLQDLNIDFVNTSGGSLFLNSSFGVLPTVSGNIPAPIFPLTSLGISARWKLTPRYTLLTAFYDGSATNFDDNPHNLKWKLGVGEGLLIFGELQREISVGNAKGVYKAGIYLHQHFVKEAEDYDEDVDTLFRNNNGIYIIGDQMIWQNSGNKRNLGVFMHIGLAPRKQNTNHYYIGLGMNFTGLFSLKGNDVVGLAMAHDGLRGGRGNETTLEITYRYTVFHFLYLQPDVQYIINPSGAEKQLNNCLAIALRFGISF